MIVFILSIFFILVQCKHLVFVPVLGKGLVVTCRHNIFYNTDLIDIEMTVFLFQDTSNLTALAVRTQKLFLYLHCDLCQRYVEV
jgi:hypothetical protein